MYGVSAPHHLSAAWADADALRAKGQLAAARDLLEPVADVAAIRLGPDDPDVIETMRRLAMVHRELGELASARRVLEEALEGAQLRLGDEDPIVLGISAELGAIADELGNRHEARRNFSRVANYGPAAFGAQHPYVRAAQRFLGVETPFAEPAPEAQATFPTQATPTRAAPRSAPPVEEEPGVYRPPWPLPPEPESAPAPEQAPSRSGRHQAPEPGPAPEPAPPRAQEAGPRLEHAALPWYQQTEPVPEPVPVDPFASLDAPSRFETAGRSVEEPHRSRTPLIALGVVALAAVVAATVVGLVVLLSPHTPQAGSGSGASAGASIASTAPGAAPTDVQLRDDGGSVTLTWSDPSGGKVPFFVEVGKPGAQLQLYNTLSPGETTYRVVGLNPRLDYCFSVIAVYGTNVVAPSNLVCTSRTGNATPSSGR
jgi:hypothetical protein